MKDLMREEWLRETKMFRRTTTLVLRYLLGSGRIPVSEALFMEAYSDIRSRLSPSRGWWNPLLSPYTIYHFYDQGVMVLSPVSSETEFIKSHGVRPEDVVELIKEGRLTVLLGAPHTSYACSCFEDILNAQGSLPTILRLTESIKAALSYLFKEWIYDTRLVSDLLSEKLGLKDPDLSDAAARISDLAALGYIRLARELVHDLIRGGNDQEARALVRAVHHILAEPVIDSGATIGIYSKLDLQFIKSVAQSTSKIAKLVAETLWSLGAATKIRVPRRFTIEKLRKFLEREDTIAAHKVILEYRIKLQKLVTTRELTEIKEIADLAVYQIKNANKAFHDSVAPSKILTTLGFVAQTAVSVILPTPPSWAEKLLTALAGTALSTAADRWVKKTVEKLLIKLLTTEKYILISPITPMIFETELL